MHSLRLVIVDGVTKYQIVSGGTYGVPEHTIAVFAAADDATAWVSYLNGGGKPPGPFPGHGQE